MSWFPCWVDEVAVVSGFEGDAFAVVVDVCSSRGVGVVVRVRVRACEVCLEGVGRRKAGR